MSTVLTASAVTKWFGRRVVLPGIDVTVHSGAVTVVVGARGTGRSTLVRCLSGVYRPDGGTVVLAVDGESVDLVTADVRTLAWVRRHHLAVADGPVIAPPRLPVVDVVARRGGMSVAQATAALEGLDGEIDPTAPLGALRPKQRATVALAAALWTDAPVVLLDDPDLVSDSPVVAERIAALADAGACVLLTALPDSSLLALADARADLEEGTMRWVRQ